MSSKLHKKSRVGPVLIGWVGLLETHLFLKLGLMWIPSPGEFVPGVPTGGALVAVVKDGHVCCHSPFKNVVTRPG